MIRGRSRPAANVGVSLATKARWGQPGRILDVGLVVVVFDVSWPSRGWSGWKHRGRPCLRGQQTRKKNTVVQKLKVRSRKRDVSETAESRSLAKCSSQRSTANIPSRGFAVVVGKKLELVCGTKCLQELC